MHSEIGGFKCAEGCIVLVHNHLDKEWCNAVALINITEGIWTESGILLIDACTLNLNGEKNTYYC